MSYISVDKGNHQFPNRDVSEAEKNTPKYSLDYTRAIYNRYLNDKCAIRYNDSDRFDLLRNYGRGSQPVEIYKSFLNSENGQPSTSNDTATANSFQSGRKGYNNIQWDVVSPIPKIRTIIKGYLDQFGQDIFVDAVDALSGDMKESIKWRAYMQANQYEFIKEYHLKAGIPMEELDFMPANPTELNLFEAMGGFKLNYASAMEQLIRHTEDISNMDTDLKDRFADDAMDLGMFAAKIEFNKVTKKYQYRYVDPKYLIIQHVQNNDYTRSEYAGERRKYTISELKQYLPDKPESFFKNIAYDYNGRGTNKKIEDWDNYSKLTANGVYNYDSFVVEVFDAEWIDYECERNLIGTTNRGRRFIKPIPMDAQPKSSERAKDIKTKLRKLRTAKWLIGTDVIFDEGLANMQDRPKMSEVTHNYKLITLRDKPLTESLIPIADDIAISSYKYQDARAMAVQAGYTIDVGMMQNIESGGNKFDFLKLLEYWRKTGWLMYMQSQEGPYQGGKTDPVTPIPSIMQDILNEAIQTWEFALKKIEDITGINQTMLGATTNPNAAVGTTQLSTQASINSLRPMIDAIGNMKKLLAESTMRRLQLAFKARKDIADAYVSVVGQDDVDALIIAEKDAVQYGLTFEPRPSDEAKQDVINGAMASMSTRREGGAGLTLSQYIYIVDRVRGGGNLKELSAMIDFLVSKHEKQIEEQKEKMIALQGQQNKENMLAAAQADQQKESMKVRGELAVEDKKGNNQFKNTLAGKYPELFRREAEAMSMSGGTTPQMPPQQPVEPLSQPQSSEVPLESQSA